jgi:phosphoglycolate phosphatase
VRLKDLLAYEDIVIQCHNDPDADAIASGFAVYAYLKSQGKAPRLIYAGHNIIRKTNLLMIIEDLQIPIEHVEKLERPELLIMVDCQYKGGNTTVFDADHIAVIDHHRICTELPELAQVDSKLGACATLIWKMLKAEGFAVRHNRELSTALYYGLYTDTSGFTEIAHPLDKDLRDEAEFDTLLMTKYRNANLSLEELEVAGAAILKTDYMDEYRAAIVKTGFCDPNVLGIISDFVLAVDAIDISIVFNVQPGGVKISVRSCVKEVKASELAEALCDGIGSGGGHLVKAGGFIQMDLLTEQYLVYCRANGCVPRMEPDITGRTEQPTASGIKAVLEHRFCAYMDNTDIVYAEDCKMDGDDVNEYYGRPIAWGYIRATDLLPEGTEVNIRTIQGDMHTVIGRDVILVIAPKGGLFLRREKDFLEQFRIYPEWKFRLNEVEYAPTIKNLETDRILSPVEQAMVCVPNGRRVICARQLTRKVKLFREDDPNQEYQLGRVGDYLMDSSDLLHGIRIMKKDLFEQLYYTADQKKEQQVVVFDLDGTLLDTLWDLKEAVNAALTAENMPLCTLEQVRQYVGNGVRKLMIRAVPEGENNPRFENAFAVFKEYYAKHCLDHTCPYPDVVFLLKELKQQGIRTAIVSNKLDSAVKELCTRFFEDYVEAAIGETPELARKPAPDMVNRALEELGVDKSQAVYVGDSEVDIQTAANAGLDCISVTWGFREKSFLRAHGAKTFVQSPLELLNLI